MKGKVLNFVNDITEEFENKNHDLNKHTTLYISDILNISRNTASQYLNELNNLGLLIKIKTRPVYFFHKGVLTAKYKINFSSNIFDSMKEFKREITDKFKEDVFKKAIGYNSSLSYCIEQCKASVSYPPSGLPILLLGPTGSGKSFFAYLMHEYAIDRGFIEKDKPFVVLNCAEFADNPELLTANLFGYKKGAFTGANRDTFGLLHSADGGMLFLDEVHCLSSEGQEKLFLFMDKGVYHMLGDNENWIISKAQIIFATTKNPEEVLTKTLLRRIPIVAQIPCLEERSIDEKKTLIYDFLKGESDKIKKRIFISNQVYNILLGYEFPGNVGQLKNCIINSCASAFVLNSESDVINIQVYNLPNYLLGYMQLKNIKFNFSSSEKKMIGIDDLKKLIDTKGSDEKYRSFCYSILNIYEDYLLKKINFEDFLKTSFIKINSYYDYLVFEKKGFNNTRIEAIKNTLTSIINILEVKYSFKFHNNNIIALSIYLYQSIQWQSYSIIDEEEIKRFNKLLEFLKKNLYKEYLISFEISELVNSSFDIQANTIDFIILALTIKSLNKDIDINKTLCVILSHGYSTASSIADATNRLIGKYVFEAIDMPLEATTKTILNRLKIYLERMSFFKEIILLVDMGSLEDIYEGLETLPNRNIGIINNITTRLALDVGFKVIGGETIENILEFTSKNNYSSYKIIKNLHKIKGILTVCITGIGTAQKIAILLKNSIAGKLDFTIMPYEYGKLMENNLNDEVFTNYDILCIVGTVNPYIDGIPFLSIEDIVTNQDLDILQSVFNDFLDKEEIRELNQQILKNFSLQNLLEHLTILNVNKVLDYVEEAIQKLQLLMERKFSNKTIVGLYIHMSCLIERLIMKNDVEYFEAQEQFAKENKEFISQVKECFSVVEEKYSVEIPISEIVYIYDFIRYDEE